MTYKLFIINYYFYGNTWKYSKQPEKAGTYELKNRLIFKNSGFKTIKDWKKYVKRMNKGFLHFDKKGRAIIKGKRCYGIRDYTILILKENKGVE